MFKSLAYCATPLLTLSEHSEGFRQLEKTVLGDYRLCEFDSREKFDEIFASYQARLKEEYLTFQEAFNYAWKSLTMFLKKFPLFPQLSKEENYLPKDPASYTPDLIVLHKVFRVLQVSDYIRTLDDPETDLATKEYMQKFVSTFPNDETDYQYLKIAIQVVHDLSSKYDFQVRFLVRKDALFTFFDFFSSTSQKYMILTLPMNWEKSHTLRVHDQKNIIGMFNVTVTHDCYAHLDPISIAEHLGRIFMPNAPTPFLQKMILRFCEYIKQGIPLDPDTPNTLLPRAVLCFYRAHEQPNLSAVPSTLSLLDGLATNQELSRLFLQGLPLSSIKKEACIANFSALCPFINPACLDRLSKEAQKEWLSFMPYNQPNCDPHRLLCFWNAIAGYLFAKHQERFPNVFMKTNILTSGWTFRAYHPTKPTKVYVVLSNELVCTSIFQKGAHCNIAMIIVPKQSKVDAINSESECNTCLQSLIKCNENLYRNSAEQNNVLANEMKKIDMFDKYSVLPQVTFWATAPS